MDKEQARQKIEELASRFSSLAEEYKSTTYNEAQTRRDFIDPFFTAMGWDVDNVSGLAQSFREVIYEDKIKVGKETKAPDYSFNYGNRRLFFVEAKKPHVNIKDATEPAYQVRRYGASAKLSVSILTNFEEFAIYDCTKVPNQFDKAGVARICYFNYKDYLKNFDFLYDTFSRENVLRGSLDKYIASVDSKHGTDNVDSEFLKLLDSLREILAEGLIKKNKSLDSEQINSAIQNTIDRIIFLRMVEDREIEPYGVMRDACGKVDCYKNLFKVFEKADITYNSGLFDFTTDTTSKNLIVDDKIIKKIINDLYYPDCPYEFSVMPVEILGSAYEQFLGKTITIGKRGKAEIDYKPEVRKAGGVYYTPEYIVNYIIENTIGELVKNKTPEEVSKIKILDPACGSGSFLVGAYQYLLNWHKNYYSQNSKKGRGLKTDVLTPYGELTNHVKKQILINNIFGVDIDVNAVEVTKLSLLLKCLEGETISTIQNEKSIFGERALPTLDKNILSGNSLIDLDFYSGELDFKEMKKIKPFSFENEFFKKFGFAGFDVVIGNPPYVKEYTHKEIFENVKKTGLIKYYQGKMDLWYLFASRGIDLLKRNGLLGIIATNNWITNSGASLLRNKILTETQIKKYIDFGDYKVFKQAGIQTMVFVLSKYFCNDDYKINFSKIIKKDIDNELLKIFLSDSEISKYAKQFDVTISPKNMLNKLITFTNSENEVILSKIKAQANYHFNDKEITQGIVANPDTLDGKSVFIIAKNEISNFSSLEKRYIKKYHTTCERYSTVIADKYVLYLTKNNCETLEDIKNIEKHLLPFKAFMEKRRETIQGKIKWFQLHWSRKENTFLEGTEKIISVGRTGYPKFFYTRDAFYGSRALFFIQSDRIHLRYATGILNSKVVKFWLYHKGKKQGDQLQVDKEPLLNIPIVNTSDKKTHDEIVKLVDTLLETYKLFHEESLESNRQILKGKIDYCEARIDELVYGLYGLSESEIKIIEGDK